MIFILITILVLLTVKCICNDINNVESVFINNDSTLHMNKNDLKKLYDAIISRIVTLNNSINT